ncbi:hypothetical protein O4H49_01235 [Kiloniella laminariae]|uniref:PAS domain-containing protein n=1 Tax=Kiloniella laminariae TaxID=454162 RepID=A0ABT4LE53_9PROT|nr:hypothetical protein [Kiloniella laminariae]MCZ4279379.1 hypothetical protein [Kiloniella laminariae]
MHQTVSLSGIQETNPVYVMASFYADMAGVALSRLMPPANHVDDTPGFTPPLWTSFDPLKVRKILPWIMVIQRVNTGPEGHVIKLEGERIIELSGINSMGKSLAEAFSGEIAEVKWQELDQVSRSRSVSFTRSPVPRENRAFIEIFRGCFPFCDEQGEISRFLVVVAPVKDDLA